MAWLGLLSFATLLAAVAYHAPRNCSIKSLDATHAVQCTLPGVQGIQGLLNMSKSGDKELDFPYTHLWVDSAGETHLKRASFKGFEKKVYASDPQYVLEGPSPTKTVFTQLDAGNFQDWHSCPQVQFVTTVSGKWYVKASDGEVKVMGPGEILFQDNVKDSPAKKQPKHQSGVVGDFACQQFITQVSQKPEVDNPGSL